MRKVTVELLGGKLLRESFKEFHLIRLCKKVANTLGILTDSKCV